MHRPGTRVGEANVAMAARSARTKPTHFSQEHDGGSLKRCSGFYWLYTLVASLARLIFVNPGTLPHSEVSRDPLHFPQPDPRGDPGWRGFLEGALAA